MAQANGHMTGKICLITGATSGIGEEAALALAQMGARVVVVGRSMERGAATLDRINRAVNGATVDLMLADLSVQAQVRQLAEAFKQRYSQLDVLVNNAGAMFARRQESADGIELTFALNHLNYFLLTHELLDVLKASAPARIVNVSSDAHQRPSGINFDDVQAQRGFTAWGTYGQSKLANVLFTYELARRLAGTGVTANVMHPGFVATRFGLNNGGVVKLGMGVAHLAALSPEQGARTIVYLAASPEVEGVTGKYFVKEKEVQSSSASYDQAAAQRLWQLSEKMTGR